MLILIGILSAFAVASIVSGAFKLYQTCTRKKDDAPCEEPACVEEAASEEGVCETDDWTIVYSD